MRLMCHASFVKRQVTNGPHAVCFLLFKTFFKISETKTQNKCRIKNYLGLNMFSFSSGVIINYVFFSFHLHILIFEVIYFSVADLIFSDQFFITSYLIGIKCLCPFQIVFS